MFDVKAQVISLLTPTTGISASSLHPLIKANMSRRPVEGHERGKVFTRMSAAVDRSPKENMLKYFAIVVFLELFILSATAQTGAPASSPARSIGFLVYPRNQQNGDQQLKDESDSYDSAKQTTSVDPHAPPPAAPSAARTARSSTTSGAASRERCT